MSGIQGRKRQQEQDSNWINTGLGLLKGAALGGITALGVLGIMALLMSGGMLGRQIGDQAALLAAALGALSGGLVTIRRCRLGRMTTGVAVGAMLFLLLLSAGVLLMNAAPGAGEMGLTCGACLCGGGLSGALPFGRTKHTSKKYTDGNTTKCIKNRGENQYLGHKEAEPHTISSEASALRARRLSSLHNAVDIKY